jgi:hypothetical protein
VYCIGASARQNTYSNCVPQLHTRSARLDTMPTPLGSISLLTTRLENNLTTGSRRTTSLTNKEKYIMEPTNKDARDKRQVCSPTQRVRDGHGESSEGSFLVRRVYKQLRQRVRWTCEYCQTVFTTSITCHTCGHQKCKNCTRDP